MKTDIKGYPIHRTSNRNASQHTTKKESFDGSNTFGRWRHSDLWQPSDDIYVVYSYGEHHPMYIYSSLLNEWFENGDKYDSPSSKRHYAQLKPNSSTHIKSHEFMVNLTKMGVVEMTKQRVAGNKTKLTRAESWVGGQWR